LHARYGGRSPYANRLTKPHPGGICAFGNADRFRHPNHNTHRGPNGDRRERGIDAHVHASTTDCTAVVIETEKDKATADAATTTYVQADGPATTTYTQANRATADAEATRADVRAAQADARATQADSRVATAHDGIGPVHD
jgi:hypothetical protein